MIKRMADLTEREFIEAGHRAMPRFLEAQRVASALYATQFALDSDASMTEADSVPSSEEDRES